MNILDTEKNDTAGEKAVEDSGAKEDDDLLLIRVIPGHLHIKVQGAMRVFLPIGLVFLLHLLYRAGLDAGRRQAGIAGPVPKLKYDPNVDITAYVQRVNSTIGGLVTELEGLLERLAVLQQQHKS